MSMSQEEIEALMSGAGDVEIDSPAEESSDVAIEDEIVEEGDDTDIDAMLANIENMETEESSSEEDDTDINDILAGIDGIVDDTPEEIEETTKTIEEPNIESLIEEGTYPLPVKSENKVVNQLNEVAEDSEEKASKIFDVLSFILDENNEIQTYNKKMGAFIEKQTTLLESLNIKFPSINAFNENLELAKELSESSKNISTKVDAENNKIFEAMELMQFHDINRQKIERVMSVIRKLNGYLNGIFEDDSDKPEVQIAKHISGDSNSTVDTDDLESLIAEFAN
jgi:hypothetical protein